MHRRSIVGAKYNPRTITDDGKRRLRAILDSDHGGLGMLGPVTVNERTGTLVSGHQRLAILDALEGHDNYLLDVAIVNLTEAQEVAANIGFNNDLAGGGWDVPLLAEAFKTEGLDLELTGFTPLDLALSFEDPELSALFQPNEATASLVSELAGIKADSVEQKKAGKPGSGSGSSSSADGDDEHSGEGDSGSDPEPSVSDKARAFRKRGKELFDTMDDTEVMACVVFKSREERENFMERMGLARDERYIDGSRVVARIADS